LRWKRPVFVTSAVTGSGCRELGLAIMRHLEKKQNKEIGTDRAERVHE
jgi:putative protein kinase ArgK-like GTPase of G3E family